MNTAICINSSLEEAYQLFQAGNTNGAMRKYQQILIANHKWSSNFQESSSLKNSKLELKTNIICTIGVLASAVGNYNYAQQLIEQFLEQCSFSGNLHTSETRRPNSKPSLLSTMTWLRIRINLIFFQIINKEYEQSLKMTDIILLEAQDRVHRLINCQKQFGTNRDANLEVIESSENVLQYLTQIFFRVDQFLDVQTISDQDINSQLTLPECYYYLNIAFCQQLLNVGDPSKIIKSLYKKRLFLHNDSENKDMYQTELAVICLRHLLFHYEELSLTQQQFYEQQLSKIKNIFQFYELDNSEAIKCCQQIAKKVIDFYKKYKNDAIGQNIERDQALQQWKMVLGYFYKKIIHQKTNQNKKFEKNIIMLKQQQNMNVIHQMMANDFYQKNLRAEIIKIIADKLIKNVETIRKKYIRYAFLQIFYKYRQRSQLQLPLHQTKVSPQNRETSRTRKRLFTNNQNSSIGVSRTSAISASKISSSNNQNYIDYSLLPSTSKSKTPSKNTHQKMKIQGEHTPVRNYTPDRYQIMGLHENQKRKNNKFIAKTLRYCECGSFLSKRNYNSNGGQYRFVKVTNSVIKWAKNPEKIEDGCQLYPLKDVRSIHYGKCTPTLLKSTNNFLKTELCFSLHLQKRTLDFHCKDSEQAKNWVCGLTQKLKTVNPKFKGYTRGKLLWIRMFMILREQFTKDLREHQKNYYYENAQAIILFGKNGCKLPDKNIKN